MTLIALKCPHCHSEDVGKHGICNGKQRYICKNPECPHTTFYTEYTYNACKPGVKAAVHKQAVNGSGVRATSRCLGISTDTVIAELKKEADIGNVNKEYFPSRSHGKVVDRERDLFQMIAALHSSGGFPCCLHCRKQESDQDTDDRNDHQEFNEGKTEFWFRLALIRATRISG